MSIHQHPEHGLVEYVVEIRHWDSGELDITVRDVGSSETDRKAVAYALRVAADRVENGEVAFLQ